ncbi:CC171 protein, partial [Atrichornis clamosus]|nr:CC171 protein [Atrichornis clamosus]
GSLQQQVFEFSRKLHTAEVECQSLHLQLADFRWSFDELKKEAEKAQSLQEQLNALQHRMTTQGNIQEELSNALQREREARLLLHEQEQRLQELNRRLELPSSVDTDKSQNMNESLRRTSEAPEELRRRDRVLNQQKRLLKHMEEDRCRLQENIQEAERALQVAAKEKELLINHMKAVEATLHEVRI